MIELLYGGGLRASEAAGLSTTSVHDTLGVVRIMGKGNKERIVPLGRPALRAVDEYVHELRPELVRPERPTDRLLLSRTGRPLERVAVWQIIKRTPGTPASPRHTRTRSATASPRTCSPAAPTSASSRNCWATATFKRRRSTPTSTAPASRK